MSLFLRTGNNYGREAAAFFKRSLYAQLLGTTTAAKRPRTIGSFGCEAVAFLILASSINKRVTTNNYDNEAVAILNLLRTTTAAIFLLDNWELWLRSGRLLNFGF